ncbi:Copper centre Cu(A) [Cucumis melo var. makuwa]|uniref:Copper centre Cu(A) n=1 Tax=Cucumis melo var. makuwa TaxID=1194695 RepID=A0A5A7VI55_CUCMM|nr:Copper centre Cu(A) [Cucumis melo var. makuwa]
MFFTSSSPLILSFVELFYTLKVASQILQPPTLPLLLSRAALHLEGQTHEFQNFCNGVVLSSFCSSISLNLLLLLLDLLIVALSKLGQGLLYSAYTFHLVRDPYLEASTGMRKACRLVRLNETFENESAHFQVLRNVSTVARATEPGQVRKALMTQDESHGAGKESKGKRGYPRPDHLIRSNRKTWFCSQSYLVTFVYQSDGSPFDDSLGFLVTHVSILTFDISLLISPKTFSD